MPESNISQLPSFKLNEVKYTYHTDPMIFGDSAQSINAGADALYSLPENIKAPIINNLKNDGMMLLFNSKQHITSNSQHFNGLWCFDYSPGGARHMLRNGGIRIGGAVQLKPFDGLFVEIATGNLPQDAIQSVLAHELEGHQAVFFNNYIAAKQNGFLIDSPACHPEQFLDPYHFRKMQFNGVPIHRSHFHADYMREMSNYFQRNGFNYTGPTSDLLFRRPLHYFVNDLKNNLELSLGLPRGSYHIPLPAQEILKNAFLNASNRPISELIIELHKQTPWLSYKDIRKAVVASANTMRLEVAAHYRQACFHSSQNVFKLSPLTSTNLENAFMAEKYIFKPYQPGVIQLPHQPSSYQYRSLEKLPIFDINSYQIPKWRRCINWGGKVLKTVKPALEPFALGLEVYFDHKEYEQYYPDTGFSSTFIRGATKFLVNSSVFYSLASAMSTPYTALYVGAVTVAELTPDAKPLYDMHMGEVKKLAGPLQQPGLSVSEKIRRTIDVNSELKNASDALLVAGMQRFLKKINVFRYIHNGFDWVAKNNPEAVRQRDVHRESILIWNGEKTIGPNLDKIRDDRNVPTTRPPEQKESATDQKDPQLQNDFAEHVGRYFHSGFKALSESISDDFENKPLSDIVNQNGFSNAGSNQGISFIGAEGNSVFFKLDADSPLVKATGLSAADINACVLSTKQVNSVVEHGVINTGDVVAGERSIPFYGKDAKSGNAKKFEFEKITKVAIGDVDGHIGITATIGDDLGDVGIAPVAGGFVIGVSAEFGEGFLAALGAGLAVGACVAVVAYTALYFYKRHQRKLLRINAAIENTNKDSDFIKKALDHLNQSLKDEMIDLDALLKETQSTLSHIQQKIYKEEERGNVVKGKKRRKYANAHYATARQYQGAVSDLTKLKLSLQMQKVCDQFVNDNKDKSSDELITLAKSATNKRQFNDNDVAEIQGVRQLLLSRAIELVRRGKLNEAKNLMSSVSDLQYFEPGQMDRLVFGSGYGSNIDDNTQKDINSVNKRINDINNKIARGENPTDACNSLITLITQAHGGSNSIKRRWEKRKDNKKNNTATKDQWKARMGLLDDIVTAAKQIKDDHKNGVAPKTLHFEGMVGALKKIAENPRTANEWISFLKATDNDYTAADKQTRLVYEVAADSQIFAEFVSQLMSGKSEDSVALLAEAKSALPDNAEFYGHVLNRVEQMKPNMRKKVDYWFGRIETLNKIEDDDLTKQDVFELDIADMFVMRAINNHVLQGDFDEAERLAALNQAAQQDAESIEHAVNMCGVIKQLKGNIDNIDFCRTRSKEIDALLEQEKNKEEPNQNGINKLNYEKGFIDSALESDIIHLIANGKFDDAIKSCEQHPDPEKINGLKAAIPELNALDPDDMDAWFKAYHEATNNKQGEQSDKDRAIETLSKQHLMQYAFTHIAKKDYDDAIKTLTRLKDENPDNADHYQVMVDEIKAGKNIGEEGFDYWLNRYSQSKQLEENNKSSEDEMDDKDRLAINTSKAFSSSQFFAVVNEFLEDGLYGKYADHLEVIEKKHNEFKFKLDIENARFSRSTQMLSLFIRPIINVLAREVSVMKPSKIRAVGSGILTIIDVAEIPFNNPAALVGQYAHGFCSTPETCDIASRNINSTFKEVGKELGIQFDNDLKAWQFSKPTMNGALMYAQLGLKAVQYVPMTWFVDDTKLICYEGYRNQAVAYCNLGFRVGFTGNAAWKLWSGVRNSSAYKGQMQSMVLQAGLEFASYKYKTYKANRGEAVENPDYYKRENIASTALTTYGMTCMALAIASGWGIFAYGVLAAGSAMTAHAALSNAGNKNDNADALDGAMSNVAYFDNLLRQQQYFLTVPLKSVLGRPSKDQIESVKSHRCIIISKRDSLYFAYLPGQHDKTTHVIISIAGDSLDKVDWQASANKEKRIEDDCFNIRLYLFQKHSESPAIDYLMRAALFIFETDQFAVTDDIRSGSAIKLIMNKKDEYRLYFKEKEVVGYLYEDIPATPAFSELPWQEGLVEITEDNAYHQQLRALVQSVVLNAYKQQSVDSINDKLKIFGGLRDDKDDPEKVRYARVMHLYQTVNDKVNANNEKEVIKLTDIVIHNNQKLISENYRLPAYLCWQTIIFQRLATYAQSPSLILAFQEQYQTYSKLIETSAPRPWYHEYFPVVREALEHIVAAVLRQYVVLANRENNPKNGKEKNPTLIRQYLNQITQEYAYVKHWHELMTDDLKFLACSIYFSIGDYDNAKLFFKRIANFPEFLKLQNDKALSKDALEFVNVLDQAMHKKLLLSMNVNEAHAVDATDLVINTRRLIERKEYDDVLAYLDKQPHFDGAHYLRAYSIYHQSNRADIIRTVDALMKEEYRDIEFWNFLLEIVLHANDSIKYCPDSTARINAMKLISGLISIVVDELKRYQLKPRNNANLTLIQNQVNECLKNIVLSEAQGEIGEKELTSKVTELLNYGHKVLRGDTNYNLYKELKITMESLALEQQDSTNRFIPLDVPADGDCAFHVFGLTRKEGIDLLKKHVHNQSNAHRWWVGQRQRWDVINILLDDLQIQNDCEYTRDQDHSHENVKRVEKYLDELAKPGVFMPYNQTGKSVLDALALLLEKNLSIYGPTIFNQINLASQSHFNDEFETIHMLHTSAEGFSSDEIKMNHFVKLQPVVIRIELVNDDYGVATYGVHERPASPPSIYASFHTVLIDDAEYDDSDMSRPGTPEEAYITPDSEIKFKESPVRDDSCLRKRRTTFIYQDEKVIIEDGVLSDEDSCPGTPDEMYGQSSVGGRVRGMSPPNGVYRDAWFQPIDPDADGKEVFVERQTVAAYS